MISMTRTQQNRPAWPLFGLLGIVICASFSGCTSVIHPIEAIPAHRVPREFLAEPRANRVPVDLARLRQVPPPNYLLDDGDLLGIYIEGVLGEIDSAPPVHFPETNSDLPPAIGFPIPVREDGTLNLPLVPALMVRGLTLAQAEEMITRAYTVDNKLIKADEARIIVTLIKERTYRVIVVRADNPNVGTSNVFDNRGVGTRSDQAGRGFVIQLPAYKNDVLQALAETGGLPGVNAKNEVKVMRGDSRDFAQRDQFIADFYKRYHETGDPCYCPPNMPEDPSIVRIPLRLPPGQIPDIKTEDIILNDGDIVYVGARNTELFYTGGLLGGGQFQLPRDFDLDVLGAIASAGGPIGTATQGIISGVPAGVAGASPTELIVLRKTPCNGQIAIKVSLTEAVNNPRSRLLVAPGDTLILRYTDEEQILNFSIGVFFTYGLARLLNGR